MKKYYKSPLNEITRSEYLRASRIKSPERYAKLKNYYKQTNMLRELDFEKLFNDDEFVWKQMTGDYIVIIAFEGAFYELQKRVRSWGGVNRIKRITKRLLTECISKALDTEDLYVSCECDDFKYRFDFWLSQEGGKYGPLQNRPPKVRNVNNNKGYVCKHILNALHGKRWVIAAASAWLDYIKANPELSSEYIWGD